MNYQNIKILYLEEDPKKINAFSELLQKDGLQAELISVRSPEEYEVSLLSAPDLILSSDSLQTLNVVSALDILKEVGLLFPFLVLAENPAVETIVGLVKKGATDIVLQEDFEELPKKIQVVLKEWYEQNKNTKESSHKIGPSVGKAVYSKLFHLNPVPSWIFDHYCFKIIDVNEAAIEHYGYSREEFLKLNVLDLHPREEGAYLRNFIERTRSIAAKRFHGTFTHLKRDTSKIKVEVNVSNLTIRHNTYSLVACIDITEKEEVLQKLKEKRARLLAAQRIAGLGHWKLDIRTQTYHISEEMYHLWGRKKMDAGTDSSSFRKAIHPDDRKRFYEAQQASIEGRQEHELEYRILLPDGNIRWLHERGRILEEEEGKPVVMERTVQDITERKLFLEKLMLSESRHRGIVNSQTNYVIRTDLQGNFTFCNNKFLEDFGWLYEDAKVQGNSVLNSVVNYHHQRVLDTVTRCIAFPNQVFQIEIDKQTSNGKVRTTLWEYICLTHSNDEPFEIQCVGIDVSARVKAQQALVESNTRYELVSEATSDAIWDLDLNTGGLFWGKAYQSLFGHQPHPFSPLEKSWVALIHPDDQQRVTASFKLALAGNTRKWQEEYRYQNADGDYTYVIDRGYIIRDESGKAIRMVGAMQDVTEKRKVELDLLKSYEEKDIILESIEDAFFAVTNDWTVTYWNRQAEKLLDSKKDEVLNRNICKVFPELKETSFLQKLFQVQKDKTKRHFEAYFDRTDSWYEVTAYPSQNGLSVYFKDVSERKRSEIQLLELNANLKSYTEELVTAYKDLEQFSFIVSHNLRAPVANIIGLSDLMLQEEYPPEVKDNLQKELVNNVYRLDDVISDLNTILQVRKGTGEKTEAVNLSEILHSIQESISTLIAEEEVEIIADFKGVGEIQIIRSYLYSILYNLISNSIKYRQPYLAPCIHIKARQEGDQLNLCVSDNGLGIDLPKEKEQVFNLYKRFHDHVQGKGMGLFMVKTQVEMLNGKISLTSEVNEGTTFYIEFKDVNPVLELSDDTAPALHNS